MIDFNMIDFNIDTAIKQAYLQQRLEQLKLEKYGHELNRKTAEALNNAEETAYADEAIAIIQTAISVAEQELTHNG